jgi:hypothetical protein
MTTMLYGTAQANRLIAHLLTNAAIANMGDATGVRGSTTAGSFYVALHTALPTADDATSHEYSDANYARVAIARATGAGGITLTTTPDAAKQVKGANTTAMTMDTAVASVTTPITHASLTSSASGAGHIHFVYEFPSPIVPVVSEIIVIAAGALIAMRITVNDV